MGILGKIGFFLREAVSGVAEAVGEIFISSPSPNGAPPAIKGDDAQGSAKDSAHSACDQGLRSESAPREIPAPNPGAAQAPTRDPRESAGLQKAAPKANGASRRTAPATGVKTQASAKAEPSAKGEPSAKPEPSAEEAKRKPTRKKSSQRSSPAASAKLRAANGADLGLSSETQGAEPLSPAAWRYRALKAEGLCAKDASEFSRSAKKYALYKNLVETRLDGDAKTCWERLKEFDEKCAELLQGLKQSGAMAHEIKSLSARFETAHDALVTQYSEGSKALAQDKSALLREVVEQVGFKPI